jgi:hypothetical protein
MKILLIIALLFVAFNTEAQPNQRKRKILFDADIKTPVDSGFYAIGIVDNQPYLINHRADSIKFKMEYDFVRSLSTGNSKNITLTKNHHLVFCLTDSVNFILPNPTDTNNRYVNYNIYYLGWRGGAGNNNFTTFDNTYRISFSDSVYFKLKTSNTTYRTKVLDHLSVYSFFRLTPNSRFCLEIINNKWYLSLKDFEY